MELGIACGPANVDAHVAAFDPAQLLQALQERCDSSRRFRIVCGQTQEHADAPHSLGLLRVRDDGHAPPRRPVA